MTTSSIDPLIFGQRVRHFRKQRGLTLSQLGEEVGKPGPYLSMVETGKREPRIGLINDLAAALEVTPGELLAANAPSRRAQLEVALERAQRETLYRDLGLPYLKASSRIPDTALEHILALYEELRDEVQAPVATPEQAIAANIALRAEMRRRDNYFAEIEAVAADAVHQVGLDDRGAMSKGDLNVLAAHFGFTVHRAADVPASVRSVTDLRHRRIYVPQRDNLATAFVRPVVLQTLGHFALGHEDPADFADFLRQRVEANYFAGAVLVPESSAVPFLEEAKEARNLSVEDLKDHFYVSYEMAAHRFTNLATEHLGLRTHFIRSDEQGIIWKAYENDGVPFPSTPEGAIEGLRLCRLWGTRRTFRSDLTFAIHYQYTDTPAGTFWCATFVEEDRQPLSAITVGIRFEDARWFRGWDTDRHSVSRCPDPACCRRPAEEQVARWEGYAWPAARPNSHVLAAMPVETIPGVDMVEIYEFLERQAPR